MADSDKSARHLAAIEQQLIEHPDNTSLYQVYSDLLQSRGDPRGQLIAIQIERTRLGELGEAETALLHSSGESLAGPLWPHRDHIELMWHLGFVVAVAGELGATSLSARALAGALQSALHHPAYRLLAALEVRADNHDGRHPHDLSPLVAALAGPGQKPPLRKLSLGAPLLRSRAYERVVDHIGDAGPLLRAYPQLEDLRLAGQARLDLGQDALPQLRRLELVCNMRAPDTTANLTASRLPALSHLTLHLGYPPLLTRSPQYIDAFDRLFEGSLWPRLTSLTLLQCPRAVAERLLRSRCIEGLTALTLVVHGSDIYAGDAIARLLLREYPRLGKLASVDLTGNYLSDSVAHELGRLPIQVTYNAFGVSVLGDGQGRGLRCSFCGARPSDATGSVAGDGRRLLGGAARSDAFICDACIDMCYHLLRRGR